jgi:hypothetical protein
MLSADDVSKLAEMEDAATSALTLAEGLDREALLRSKLTLREVRHHLSRACAAMTGLSEGASSALPELDGPAWAAIEGSLHADEAGRGDAAWLALQELMPITLGWLRVYRSQRPELFRVGDSRTP